MIRPVFVEFDSIAFPANDDGAAALQAALLRAIRAPYNPHRRIMLRGQEMLVVTAAHGRAHGTIAYLPINLTPPAGTSYLSGNRETDEPYIVISVRRMLVVDH